MPVYEFFCRDCKKTFEITQPVADFDPTTVTCPNHERGAALDQHLRDHVEEELAARSRNLKGRASFNLRPPLPRSE